MEYSVEKSIEILERMPRVLRGLLAGVSKEWSESPEDEGKWSCFDVIGHLIEGEKDDWIHRANIILTKSNEGRFEPFDRFSQEKASAGKSMDDLLLEFERRRESGIIALRALELTEEKLDMLGVHPEFGEVTLRQHLATWVAHDMAHLSQIARIIAKQYKQECGPWTQYLRVLQ